MNKSEQLNDLAGALAKAQGAMKMAKKDKKNPYFNSTYADLASAIEASRPILAENGLSVIQMPGLTMADGTIGLDTMLLHSSGQFIASTMTLKASKIDPQGLGSAITYARRYAYMSIIGLASEDDDGNAASKPKDEIDKALDGDDDKLYEDVSKKEGPNKGRAYKYKMVDGKRKFVAWVGVVNSSPPTVNHE